MQNINKSVLVIGGTGLISSAVTSELIEQSYKVTLLNRGIKKRNMEGIDYIIADIKKESVHDLEKKFLGGGGTRL